LRFGYSKGPGDILGLNITDNLEILEVWIFKRTWNKILGLDIKENQEILEVGILMRTWRLLK